MRTVYEGFAGLRHVDVDGIRDAASEIDSAVPRGREVSFAVTNLEFEADDIESAVDTAKTSFRRLLAFVKSFDVDEFGTIYCEREWRSTRAFKFSSADVAMVVLPKKVADSEYFRNFVDQDAPGLTLPRSRPIVPWDDLVES